MNRTTPKLSDEVNQFGSYEIRWSELRNGVWRSMRKSTKTGDLDAAERALARFLLDRQRLEPDTRSTVGDIFDAYEREHLKPRGLDRHMKHLLRIPRQAFGSRDPLSITQADVDEYVRRRCRGDFSPRVTKRGTPRATVKLQPQSAAREVSAMQSALNWGSKKRLMVFGKPTFAFERPGNAEPRVVWLIEAQEADVAAKLHRASRSVQLFFLMGVTYGARREAMMDLRFVPEQVNWITGSLDFNVPGARRTRKRRPHGPMKPEIRRHLEVLYQERGPGAYVLDRYCYRHFTAFMDEIGYPQVTPHVLRHTAITLALRAGMKPEAVSGAFQVDLRTMLTVYRHFCGAELDGIFGARRG